MVEADMAEPTRPADLDAVAREHDAVGVVQPGRRGHLHGFFALPLRPKNQLCHGVW
jgi:hypothetical protein